MTRMIQWLIISSFILLLCSGAVKAADTGKPVNSGGDQTTFLTVTDDYAPGQLLVKFTLPQSDEKLAKKVEKMYGKDAKKGHKISKDYTKLGLQNTYLISLSADDDPKDVKEKYKKDPDVVYAEPNYVVTVDNIPNDPSFSLLWGMHNTGQTGGTPDADIDAVEAWDLCTGSPEVVVAVVDTGVDYTHPDLAANIWVNTDEIPGNGIDDDKNGYIDDVKGWDFYNQDNNPMDDYGHGTHCAGTIGGVGSNGIGVTGVMWNVKIMPLKFMSSSGSGYTSDAVSAILYANANGADVISNSWGGGGYSATLKDAIDASPAVVVCAAGNSGANADTSPMYPAAYTSVNIISVAATDSKDLKASFSNYGVTSVDVAAPGVSIYSTLKGGSYGSMSGTSMATPHVAGLAGLLKAENPALSNLEIKNLILSNCDVLLSLQGKILTSGRINANRALSSVQPAVLSLVSVTPSTGVNNSQVSVTISGTGFKPTPVVKMVGGGGAEVIASGVTVVSSTTMTCTFDLRGKPAGTYDVVVIAQNGETAILPSGFSVQKPFLVITALIPSSATAGGQGFTLTVSGSNFTPSSKVNWNGIPRSTMFSSATQLQITLTADDLSSPGTATITVTDTTLEPSNSKLFTIITAVPVLSVLNPSSAAAGGPGFALTVTGSNFTTASVVNWNGVSRPTTFGSSNQLQATISKDDIASQGTAVVTVKDSARGTSNEKTFTIMSSQPSPTVSSVSPSSVRRGSTKTLSVSGNNFVTGASVEIRKTNYQPIACTNEMVTSGSRITCTITVPSSSMRGYWDVVVINPDGKTGTKTRGFYIN
jgi:subtilisin family serine protease